MCEAGIAPNYPTPLLMFIDKSSSLLFDCCFYSMFDRSVCLAISSGFTLSNMFVYPMIYNYLSVFKCKTLSNSVLKIYMHILQIHTVQHEIWFNHTAYTSNNYFQ